MTAVRRLLILDDEADFAAFVAKVGADLGYDARTTGTAQSFRDAYLAAPPDLIVLDMIMPELDGIEIVRWLADVGCQARIIIISGFNPDYAGAARKIGEVIGRLEISLLGKPVKLAELRAELAPGLRGPAMER